MSKDSIRRPKEFEGMLTDLCQTDKRLFNSYKDLMVFSACLGFQKKSRKPFNEASKDNIKMHIFDNKYDQAVINAIGLAETEDPDILGDELAEARVQIFEEYAAGGLEIIEARVYSSPVEFETALLDLIGEYVSNVPGILDDITNMGS